MNCNCLFRTSLILTALIAGAAAPVVSAQAQTRIMWRPEIEDSILSSRWEERRSAVALARIAIDSLSQAGRGRFVELLQRELDQTIPVQQEPGCCDEESYGSYLADLIWIVERFNDPRATPLLARQGIAWSMGSRFQVARAGDAAVPMLLGTWDRTPTIRHGVIRTFGIMVGYADSVGSPLSGESRLAARRAILDGFASPEPWLRRASTNAASESNDPSYLPILRYLAQTDTATLQGRRYVSLGAAQAAGTLVADSGSVNQGDRFLRFRESLEVWCGQDPSRPNGVCNSLRAKLDAAEAAIARGNPNAARGQTRALVQEIEAKGAVVFGPICYALLLGGAQSLVK